MAGAPGVLVAGTAWIGTSLPSLDEPGLKTVLHLTHHLHRDAPEVVWIHYLTPPELINFGLIELSEWDRTVTCNTFSAWAFPWQLLMQWRWDHDRAAVLHEDAQKAEEESLRRSQANAEKQRRQTSTLEKLATKKFLRDWRGYAKPAPARRTVAILHSLIAELIKAAPLTHEKAAELTRQAVLELNLLDEAEKGFIETIDREDICDALDEILTAAKHPDLMDLVHETRDW